MREAVEDLGRDDALGAVDAHVDVGEPREDAVVAEDVDEGEGLHQRGREERQHGHDAKQPAPRHQRPREPVGVDEGQRHRDGHGDGGDVEAVRDGGRDGGRPEVAAVVGKPDEGTVVVQEAPPRQVRHRVEDEEIEDESEEGDEDVAGQVLPTPSMVDGPIRDDGKRASTVPSRGRQGRPPNGGEVGEGGRGLAKLRHEASSRRRRRGAPRARGRGPVRRPRRSGAPRRRWPRRRTRGSRPPLPARSGSAA